MTRCVLTLRHNPQLLSGTERIREAQGRLQEARGLFDVGLRVTPALTFTLQEISPGLRARELQKRNTVRGVRDGFTRTAQTQRELLKGDLTDRADLPGPVRIWQPERLERRHQSRQSRIRPRSR